MKGFILISIVLLTNLGYGQRALMTFRNTDVKIGEQTTFVLSLEYPNPDGDALIAWPQFDDKLTDYIEILDRTVDFAEIVDSTNGIYERKQEFTVTCFDAGIHKLQPIGIELNDEMYYTNSTELLVNTVEVDTSKGITDIKENYAVEYSFGEKMEDWFRKYWGWLAGAGGLVALFFLVRLIKNRNEKEEEEVIVPVIPAHITALKALIELKKKEAWRTDKKKEFYSELTYTVRLYLEQRFGIQAIEHTTREIIQDLKYADISEEDKVYLRKILSQSDMVKFAKMVPDEQFGQDSLERSIDFVRKTKKEEETDDSE